MAKAEQTDRWAWLEGDGRKPRMLRILLLVLGVTITQFILYGPSLVGNKVLLPLDFLGQPGLIQGAHGSEESVFNPVLSDPVMILPQMLLASEQVRSGHLPLWTPYSYAGSPLATSAVYSPFWAMYYLVPSPTTLAWMQMAKALLAAGGAYVFMRRVLNLNAVPALLAAWTYPLTGFFVQWLCYPLSYVVAWFPWLLWAVDRCVRRFAASSVLLLAVITAAMLYCGQSDIAALALIASGLYACWALIGVHGVRIWRRPALFAVLSASVGWGSGILLSGPYMLPQLEYVRTGDRVARRGSGAEERPPIGLSAIRQVILPNIDGSTEKGSIFLGAGNRLESSSAVYVGILVTLLLVPISLQSRRHRWFAVGAMIFVVIGLAWCLNLPGLVWLLRQRGLNMFSYNRFVFFSAFFILALAAIGLQVLWQRQERARWWYMAPLVFAAMISYYCYSRTSQPVTSIGGKNVQEVFTGGMKLWGMPGPIALRMIQDWFAYYFTIGAVLAGFAAATWLVMLRQMRLPRIAVIAIGVVMVVDPLLYAWNANPQCDKALFYPRVGALADLASSSPHSRVLGISCLPANLPTAYGLRDICGYDAVDSKRYVDLLEGVRHPSNQGFPYAKVQWYVPRLSFSTRGDIRLPPLLDLLAVRHVIFAEDLKVPSGVHRDGLTVIENPKVLPRAFIPHRAEVVRDDTMRVALECSDSFAPAEVAFLEEATASIPDECRGTAEITTDLPSCVTVEYQTDTGGLLVLTDLWFPGWNATVNGTEARILRTNHAFRGIVLPPGKGVVTFRYQPASLRFGLLAMVVGCIVVAAWTVVVRARLRAAGVPDHKALVPGVQRHAADDDAGS